ncbi:MAG: LysR family transcriptional regulator, partial [Pseudomonadota bacterium]|nr:LysR family transcriptional regulator [Pseudomonadota bacterium]
MFDWNDLRYFLAVARHGSTIAAGKAMGISQSTVHRRVEELEVQLKRKLVTRETTGYRLTEYGQGLLAYAERVERSVLDFEQHVQDATRDLTGVIRVTCPEPIISRLSKTKFLDGFHAFYPGLRVELVTSDRYLSILKGEADVALRSGDTDEELFGRKVADSTWAIYASRSYVERFGKPDRIEDLAHHPLVALDESMNNHRLSAWLKEVAPLAIVASRASSVLGLVSSVKSGVGMGAMPMPLGDAEEDLVRVLGPVPELTRSWRLLTHPDLRHTPRISAFFDYAIENLAILKKVLTT